MPMSLNVDLYLTFWVKQWTAPFDNYVSWHDYLLDI